MIPPGLSVAEFPIGCGVAVVVHHQSDEQIIVAEGIKQNQDELGFF